MKGLVDRSSVDVANSQPNAVADFSRKIIETMRRGVLQV